MVPGGTARSGPAALRMQLTSFKVEYVSLRLGYEERDRTVGAARLRRFGCLGDFQSWRSNITAPGLICARTIDLPDCAHQHGLPLRSQVVLGYRIERRLVRSGWPHR
jgi:hypothetical protein